MENSQNMKLSDYKDANDVSLQAYVDTLIEKIQQSSTLTGFIVVCDLEKARKGENDGIHLVSTLGEGAMFTRVPDILEALAKQMKRSPSRFEGVRKLHEEEN